MTTTTLDTKHGLNGMELIFPDTGASAGVIKWVSANDAFIWTGPNGETGSQHVCLEAAQFEALAWASDYKALARYQTA